MDPNFPSYAPLNVNPPVADDQARFADYLQAGVRAAQSGDRKKSRSLLMSAVDIDPHSENAWLWLASISEYPEELLVFLNNVLDINPANERALQWSASTKSLLSKTLVQRGIDASEDGRQEFAIQCFDQALSYDDRNITAWLWLASLSDSENRKTEYLRHVLMIDPENEAARTAMAAVESESRSALLSGAAKAAVAGDASNAMAILDKIDARWPDSKETWIVRSHLAVNFEDKMAAWSRILDVDPEDAYAKECAASLRWLIDTAGSVAKDPVVEAVVVDPVVVDPVYEVPEPAPVEDFSSPTHELPPLENVVSEPASFHAADSADEHSEPELEAEPSYPPPESPWDTHADENLSVSEFDRPAIDTVEPETEASASHDAEPEQAVAPDEPAIPSPADHSDDAQPSHAVPMPFQSFEPAVTAYEAPAVKPENDVVDERTVILVVDHSATARKLIAGKLETCGFRVLCAETGREAIRMARESSPALALVDIAMPLMDGYAVCRSLRDEPATQNSPVVLISGKDAFFEEDRGAAAGASGFINKPFGPETLMKTVQSYLAEAAPNT